MLVSQARQWCSRRRWMTIVVIDDAATTEEDFKELRPLPASLPLPSLLPLSRPRGLPVDLPAWF